MTDNPQTTARKDGLHCVYGKCQGIPYGPGPCHPGCCFQMSAPSEIGAVRKVVKMQNKTTV